jgi:ABC-type transport system involved in Fe-S cluster assembly fused permease/ATPase subunit
MAMIIRSIKNGKRPIAGILHIIVYVGFVVINIELLEIMMVFWYASCFCFFRTTYNILIASFEILAF